MVSGSGNGKREVCEQKLHGLYFQRIYLDQLQSIEMLPISSKIWIAFRCLKLWVVF